MTALQTVLLATLWLVGVDELMTPYEALAHSLSTMPTGGFSTQPRSAEVFSAEAQWILGGFMLVAGANFALMYRASPIATPGYSSATRSFGSISRSRSRQRAPSP